MVEIKRVIGAIGGRSSLIRNGIQFFSDPDPGQVAHYLSTFAEVLNAGTSTLEHLRGWIIKDVEVFKAGTWRGITYTEADITAIVANFYALKGKLDPVFKVNHSEDARDQVGWVLDVRQSGELLLADLHVTEWEAYDKITNGTWKKVSAEIYLPELAKTEFGVDSHVLRAVAVVSIPQVKDIKGIVLNSERWDEPPGADPGKKTTEGSTIRMDWEKFLQMLAEFGVKLTEEQQAQLKEKGVAAFAEQQQGGGAPQTIVIGADQIVNLAEQIVTLKGETAGLVTKLAELTKENGKASNEKWIDGLIQEGKVLPAERAGVLALCEKLEGEPLAAYKETFAARPKLVDLGAHGNQDPEPGDDDKVYTAYSERFGQKTYQ